MFMFTVKVKMKLNHKISKSPSFTLIELMAVVAIIGILAGLVLGGAGAVRSRAARGQAKAEIAAIEAGLARYQMDFGAYPTAINISTNGGAYALNPTASQYIGSGNAGQILFTNLWGATNYSDTTAGRKQYLNVKPSMVNTSGVNYFIDPWGYAYGYYWDGVKSLNGGAVPDVWSTGGQTGSGTQTNRAKWISSWE
jgi:prepilin-type N-terminal cleavage/methylation domain-containing protein